MKTKSGFVNTILFTIALKKKIKTNKSPWTKPKEIKDDNENLHTEKKN